MLYSSLVCVYKYAFPGFVLDMNKQIHAMLTLVTFFIVIGSLHGLPQGAPDKVCQSMTPLHSGNLPQSSAFPFSIVPRRFQGAITVTISSLIGTPFQGFMLQGRTPDGRPVGVFENVGEFAHTISCGRDGDTATHNNPNPKKVLEFKWLPPQDYEGPIIFNGTIAQDYSTFWVGIESAPVQINRLLQDDPVPALQPNRPFSSTPPNYNPGPSYREAAMEFDPFYAGCSKSKLCFGSPEGCTKSKSCKAVVAVTAAGDKFDFEMKATQGAGWVAVALSEDEKMGDDSAIECAKMGSSVRAFLSWTSGKPDYGAERTKNQLGIRLLNHSIIDDTMYCKVRREAVTSVNGKTFDLNRARYHLLIASGHGTTAQGVEFHDITYLASEQHALVDVSEIKATSKLLIRLHGAFMIVAWIGIVSIGTLLARYYRQTWVGSSMCGKDIWFAWHRLLMMTAWLFTVAGAVMIWVELKRWSEERNPHAMLGTATTVLCFLQPIGAFFRPHPGTSKRSIFNWLHWLGGNAAHILAIITMFFAVKLTKAELPDLFDYILAGYVAFHVVVHLILSIMGCVAEKTSDGRISSFPMRDLGTGRSAPYSDRNVDAPFGVFRKITLGLYIVVIVIIVAVLVIITVLAPIEETWKAFRNRHS